jgi:hypothetical protein
MQIKRKIGHGEPLIQIDKNGFEHHRVHSYLVKQDGKYLIFTSKFLALPQGNDINLEKTLGVIIHYSKIKNEKRAERLYKRCLSRGFA